jgi:uncharacterized membrane protein YfcA
MFFTTYLIIGAFSGLLAGLLGLGGGIIVVPALAAAFAHYQVVPANYIMQMAVGTSLTTIVFTFLSSLRAHIKRDSVRWHLVKRLLPGLLGGVVLGAVIAKHIPSQWLSVFFGLFSFFVAFRLVYKSGQPVKHVNPPFPAIVCITVLIGALASILGMGGGIVLIPFLLRMKVDMRHATGTSVCCGVFMGIIASLCFMLAAAPEGVAIPWSSGFVYWPAFAGVAGTSVLFAPIGTAIAYKLEPTVLKRLLAIFLVVVAIDMLLSAKVF